MLKVYQIRLTDQEHDMVNAYGWEATLKTTAYANRGITTDVNLFDFDFYNYVAAVDTNDLEEAFRLMNLWEDPTRVTRHGKCASMSVGDVIEDMEGNLFMVASFGFEKIQLNR